MASSALAPGTVLLGELSLEEQLGRSVYRARRTRDGRELCMRVVRPRSSQEATDFLSLAATASRVRHPVLASVEAYGRIDSESCYITSELVTGQRLDDWADAIGIPPLAQVVELVRRLCVGLQAAARAGVVHDAIHVRNVRVQSVSGGSGARLPLKLLGLGVPALLFDYAQEPYALRFMAPEQLLVLSRSELPTTFRCSAQMNVYSCGALLYYLATGGPPYPGLSAPELLASHAGTPLAPPARINPQITAGLNAIVMRALALDPSDRFGSAAELGEALAAVLGSVSPGNRKAPSSSLPPMPANDEPFGPEPPTFRTSVSGIAALERAAVGGDAQPANAQLEADADSDKHDKPTLPPAPSQPAQGLSEMRDSVSGIAPIGLFSSSPPGFKSPVPALSEITNAGASKPTPLAAFSEPPRYFVAEPVTRSSAPPAAPLERGSVPSLVPTPVPTPPPVTVSEPVRTRPRPLPWPWLALPLAAVVCVLAFFTVRSLVGPGDEATSPLALPSAPVLPEQPEPPARKPTARGAVVSQPEPTQVVAPEPAPRELRPEVKDNSRVVSARRARSTSRAQSSSGRSRAAAPVAPPPALPPAPSAAREHERPSARAGLVDEHLVDSARPAASSPVALARSKPEPEPQPPAVAKAPLPPPTQQRLTTAAPAPQQQIPAVDLPLTAKAKIQGLSIKGSLPTSQVRHAVERLRPQFKACYVQAAQAAGHNGFGELIVNVEIDERGRARAPSVRGGKLPRLDACVTDAVQHLITGRVPDTGTVDATWKINFTP